MTQIAQQALITPIGIIGSRVALYAPVLGRNPKPTDRPSFFLRLMFTAADLTTPAMVNVMQAVVAAGRTKWKNFDAMAKEGAFKLPLRRDIATKNYDPEVFAGYLNIGGYEDNPPALIGPDKKPMLDQTKWYPGARARAIVRIQVVDREDNKAISVKLVAAQWAGDGERMARSAENSGDAFGELDVPADTGATAGSDLEALFA